MVCALLALASLHFCLLAAPRQPFTCLQLFACLLPHPSPSHSLSSSSLHNLHHVSSVQFIYRHQSCASSMSFSSRSRRHSVQWFWLWEARPKPRLALGSLLPCHHGLPRLFPHSLPLPSLPACFQRPLPLILSGLAVQPVRMRGSPFPFSCWMAGLPERQAQATIYAALVTCPRMCPQPHPNNGISSCVLPPRPPLPPGPKPRFQLCPVQHL